LVVDAAKKQSKRERERKTLLSEKRKCAQKEFDRADIVRDVRLSVRAQPVDATPSGIKLFSKVVFMKPGKRFGLSATQKSEMWRRWKAGQSLHEIGRAFGKEHSSIRCLVSRYGGFVPAVRRRSLLALTLREREEISRGLASGSSIREIAKRLDRVASTVSREVARHGGRSVYRANQADGEAWESPH
jgi:DNA-binding NarL/FixJ family response regulator